MNKEASEPEEDPGILVNNQQAVEALQYALLNAPQDIRLLRSSLRRVLERRAWEKRFDPARGRRWEHAGRFVKFITDGLPDGLATDVDTIKRFIADEADLLVQFQEALDRGAGGPHNPKGANQHTPGSEVNHSIGMIDQTPLPLIPAAQQGNTLQYAVRRLGRDRPDLLEKVKAGEMTANAAMVEAGFRKVETPLDLLRRGWRKASEGERETFLRELEEGDGNGEA